MAEELKNRSEIGDEYKWKLEDMYPTLYAWENEYKQVLTQTESISQLRGKISKSANMFKTTLDKYMSILEKIEKLFIYAHMRLDEDNSNSEYKGLLDRAQDLSVKFGSETSFINPEILSIDEKTIEGFIDEISDLKDYRHYINDLLRQKKHVLNDSEENIMALAGEVMSSPSHIFSMLNNADIKFSNIENEAGELVELTKGRYIKFLESKKRKVRENAFEELYGTYEKYINTIGASLTSSIKKDVFVSRVRKYPSCLEAALFNDNIPIEVYTNLISSIHNNLEDMYSYYEIRKQLLGVDSLHMYDMYVPLIDDVDFEYSFNEAKRLVRDALMPLGSEYISILEEGLNNRWIDVMENRGKTSGAYSTGCYDTHPYVLLNFQGSINDVYTLAHEMGHALHTYHSNKHQSFVNAGYTIFVAEVASTVNEILLTEYLLRTLDDKNKRLYVLNHYVEQFRTTVFRQTMFAEFEKITHEKAEAGIPLTPQYLSEIYYDLNKTYFGNGVNIDKEIELEWMRIPHFYSSFYVYKYATGFSAAVYIADRILKEGKTAVDEYIAFLSSGGSDYPVELLKKVGADMQSKEPVDQAMKKFSKLVKQFTSEFKVLKQTY